MAGPLIFYCTNFLLLLSDIMYIILPNLKIQTLTCMAIFIVFQKNGPAIFYSVFCLSQTPQCHRRNQNRSTYCIYNLFNLYSRWSDGFDKLEREREQSLVTLSLKTVGVCFYIELFPDPYYH